MKIFSKRARKNVLTLIVGPMVLVPAVTLLYLSYAVLGLYDAPIREALAVGFVASFVGLAYVAYPATLVLGLPLINILESTNNLSLKLLMIIGISIGGVLNVLMGGDVEILLLFSYCSAAVTFGCWYVYSHA